MDILHQQLIPPSAPAPISWWPPAPGWWILLTTLILLGLLLPLLLRQTRRRKQRRRQRRVRLFADLPAELSDSHWLAEINTRLKQTFKQRGDESATLLFGEAWLDYLCSRYPDARRDALHPLAADLYRPDLELSDAQRQDLLRELRRWMRRDDV